MRRTAVGLLLLCAAFSNAAYSADEPAIDLSAELRALRGDTSLVVDLNRPLIVREVAKKWQAEFAAASMSTETASALLNGLSAPDLYSAALAPAFSDVISALIQAESGVKPKNGIVKSVGDAGRDFSYTPVTPCRLVETRNGGSGVYHAAGAFSNGEIRHYVVQGSNGNCVTQLPGDLHASAVQLQVYGIPQNGTSGDIEILPDGATFGQTTSLVFLGNTIITSGSTTASINPGNNSIEVQVRNGSAHLALDVVGYFKAPSLASVTSHVVSKSSPIPANSIASVVISGCAANDIVVSGSCFTSSFFVLLGGSYLNNAGWGCDYMNSSNLDQVLSVQATCMSQPAAAR